MIVCVCLLLGIGIYWYSRSTGAPEMTYGLSYTVKAETASSGIVNVEVRITPDLNENRQENGEEESEEGSGIYFQTPESAYSDPECVTESGEEVSLEDLSGAWRIDVTSSEPVILSYDVRLGETADQNSGTVYGGFYEDLLVFQGSHVLALPWVGQDQASDIDETVTELAFTLNTEFEWDSYMPYTEPGSGEHSFAIEKPDWSVFNGIYHSSFCFGQFETITLGDDESIVYLDSAIADQAEADDLQVVETFYSYYKNLFNGTDAEAPVMLLRTDEENQIILGGTGACGAALSLDMEVASECERMSRTLYYAFFDGLIHQSDLRYAPNLWLYEGLADFYVDDSAVELSSDLLTRYGIAMQDNLATQYGRYLYYMLTDTSVSSASPDLEGQMTVIQEDFYYETKVPLVIAVIESFGETEGRSVLITYLLEHGDDQEMDWKDFTEEVLGDNEAAVNQYLSGESFIPNYWGLNDSQMSEGILPVLEAREEEYVNEYADQNMNYPSPSFTLLDTAELDAEIEERGLSFGSEEVEALVRNYSEDLYYWMMQMMLRAEVCGVEDPVTAEGKTALYDAEADALWEAYTGTDSGSEESGS